MAITESQYQNLKLAVEKAQRNAAQAQGALDQIASQLKEQFDCKSLKEARTLLESLKQEAEEAERAFDKAFQAYQKEFSDAS